MLEITVCQEIVRVLFLELIVHKLYNLLLVFEKLVHVFHAGDQDFSTNGVARHRVVRSLGDAIAFKEDLRQAGVFAEHLALPEDQLFNFVSGLRMRLQSLGCVLRFHQFAVFDCNVTLAKTAV